MENIVYVKGENLVEAYNKALVELNKKGKIYPCPAYSNDYMTQVQKEITLFLTVSDVNKEPNISKFYLSGPEDLQEYILEFIYGTRNFNVKAKNVEKNFWSYTYNQRIEEYDQIDFIIEELIRDKYSRRAEILVRDNKVDMKVNDPACLQEFDFKIRDNKLNMTTIMRSNDLTQAAGMNMYAFIEFQKRIAKKIKDRALEYQEILESMLEETPKDKSIEGAIKYLDDFKKIEPGIYNHLSISAHAYGTVLSKEKYQEYLQKQEGITLKEDETRGTTIHYEDGFVVGEIRGLEKRAQIIEKKSLEDLSYPTTGENGWQSMMEESIVPSLVELSIKKSLEYNLFDQDLINRIEEVLIDYNIPFEKLYKECQKKGIDLLSLYEQNGMEKPTMEKSKKLEKELK